MDQQDLMGMITSPSSWEQVITDVIAFEGLDPWDLDLAQLAGGFIKHVKGLEAMDFKIPAKYLMVAATLLRMKSNHLPLLGYFQEEENGEQVEGGTIDVHLEEPVLNPLTIPPLRQPKRQVVVSDLVSALRKVLGSSERRELRMMNAKGKISIKHDDIGKRISSLYDRINSILTRVKGKETTFTKVVPEWTKPEVASHFLPLIYLDQQKRIDCRQEEMFEEIYIKQGKGPEAPSRGRASKKSRIPHFKGRVKASGPEPRKKLKKKKRKR